MSRSTTAILLLAILCISPAAANWPAFRGPNASGVGDGTKAPLEWDGETGHNIRWKTALPGLAHSSPIVWGERVFAITAVAEDGKADLKAGQYGAGTAAKDHDVKHTWRLYCLDRSSGKILWEQIAYEGVPRVKRHIKATHANATPATDGKYLVAMLDSEGLFCFDQGGKLLWRQDLGVLDNGAFDLPEYQWGPASSPIIYKHLAIVQCDMQKDSFVAAFDLASGKEVWRTPREELPSWSTPTVYESSGRAELITAAPNYTRAYDPLTGKELWKLGGHSKITTPAPVIAHDLIFITDGYSRPGIKPIYAIRPGGNGDISLGKDEDSNEYVAWSHKKGGPYMPSPLAYGDYLYVCTNRGLLACYEAKTGRQVYEKQIPSRDGFSASPIAADGRLYLTSEDGEVLVIKAGPDFEVLATNALGEPCLATPALAPGMLIVRSQRHLWGIGGALKSEYYSGTKRIRPSPQRQQGSRSTLAGAAGSG